MEIERKFLVNRFPEGLPLLKEAVVYQGYLCTHPTVRIRGTETADGVSYVLCFKGKGTIARQEIEMDLTKEQFFQLKDLLPAPMIRKDYKVYALPDGHKLECSLVDQGSPSEFMFAEVEFTSLEEAEAFVPDEYLSHEVTSDPSWSMGSYWEKYRMGGK